MKTNFTQTLLVIFFTFLFSPLAHSQTCEAAFSWDDTNQTIQFFDESTSLPGDPIVSWFWDFDDDGATSTQQNPIHTFSEIDDFDVTLTITTANGCTATIEIEIEVCNFIINVSVGTCNSNNEIPITINVIDVFDNAEEIDILLDGQVLPGGPYEIDEDNPVNVTVFILGDGLSHILTVQSTEIGTCNESYSFVAEDCTSNCFLGSMQVQFTGGGNHTIQVGDDFFNPVNTTIVVGDLVSFDWIGSGHSTTSDATIGIDSWNSGVIGFGSTFNVSITNPAVHPYYCIPHGGPNGSGMAGTIVANCPPGGAFNLIINFNTTIADPAGFDVLIDGVVQLGSPHNYNGTGGQSVSASINGNGQSHVIQIRDVADPTCFAERNFLAPDCGSAPSCSISVAAMENGGCNASDEVPVELTVNSINGGTSGFNVSVDGVNDPGNPFAYDPSGVTLVTVNVLGNGLSHNLVVTDVVDGNCSGSVSISTTNCTIPCLISNLSASSGNSVTHTVFVEDFVFNPANITITSGDIIEWDWTGQIAHTSTSDAMTGADSWDSGLLNTGATYQSPVLTAGVHPYYCIPHGAPGGTGMAGVITVQANCTNGEVSVAVSFTEQGGGFNGFNIYVDGIVAPNGPFNYDPSGNNSASVNVIGDGQSHTIEVRDLDDATCNSSINFTTPNCNAPTCNLTMSAVENGSCDPNNNVPVDLTINDVGGGVNGFNILVDGNNIGTYSYSGTGTTNVTINVIGDGNNHNIQVQDIDEPTCTTSVSVITTNCTIPCVLSNLSASTGSSTTHIVSVEDFVFNPVNITITAGDIIEWDWTGQIAHTSTSDATTGADSWDSGLLNTGATYQSPVLTAGVHPYYCIPHGAPGGTGMAGTITVQANCTNGEVSANVTFNETGGSFNGYNLYVDGVLTANSPMNYDPSGNNSFSINIIGDGNNHSIEIRDVDDPTCSILTNITTPDCNASTCNLTMSAVENGSCDSNNNVPLDLTVNDVGGGTSGFNILVDGNNIGTYSYSGTGTTNVTINVIGDGQNHNIQVQDIDEATCTSTASVTTTNCTIPCVLSNLSANTGSSTTHVVGVEDFVFNPANITTTAGDIIEWDWTGQIAHTSTSDATTGADSWDSGLLNTGATYQSPVLSAGVHPYYCIPHGAPGGVGMAGTVTVQANCTNGEVSVNITFNETGGSFNGYNIYVDGVLTANSPMNYDPSGNNSASVNVIGDGNSHSIEIKDVDDPTCSILTNITTPDCNAPTCNLTMSAVENGSCDPNNNVPVDLTINDVGGGASGFTVFVDGNNIGTFAYSGTGTTNVTITVIGDGQNHNIQVQDIDEATCTSTASVTTTNCTIPCALSNLNANTGSSTTHIVGVEDFIFNPANITITAGDIIEWDWTGQIVHTSTSDATTGTDSWDSGLLNTGATYQSPVLSAGVHPYYCIPHGAPGGIGMAGTITVQANCTNGEVSVNVTFNETGGSFNGYNIYVDGILTANSPMTYDPTGSNSFSINVIGDGNNHSIEIKDVDDPTCSIFTHITTPNCNPPTCEIEIGSVNNSGVCNPQGNNPIEVFFDVNNVGINGYNLIVDGQLVSTQVYNNTAGQNSHLLFMEGDGLVHTVVIQDVDYPFCSDTISVTTILCPSNCELSNLVVENISVNNPATHIVEVIDFDFFPNDITVSAGDIVRFEWTGVIPHTTTSDATTGNDVWDSGLLGQGDFFEVTIQDEGTHPYYCIPHGAPNGVGMAGTIIANPPCSNGEVAVNISFDEIDGGNSGYNIFVDGNLYSGSPFTYHPSGNNNLVLNLPGDGQSHTIQIEDVKESTCSISQNILVPDCSTSDPCSLEMTATEIAGCDTNNEVTYELNIISQNTSSQFNILVDGIIYTGSPFDYDASGNTITNILVNGIGQNRTITIQDLDSINCSASVEVLTPLCGPICEIINLEVSGNQPSKYIVEVLDFEFFPKNIEILIGDTVEFVWTGIIPHTATSDATTGNTVFDSGLLGQGETFQVVITESGFHPYYCIPHGGPNGIGMAGSITALEPCDNGEAIVVVNFEVTNGSSLGYNVFLDGQQIAGPIPYDNPVGMNTVLLPVQGDGLQHVLTVQDMDVSFCAASVNFVAPVCELLCEIKNLSAQTGSNIIHLVEVEDFEFIPQSIDVKVGETVRFIWIGDIPHTTTSDAPFGIDSWDSGLLEMGDTFDIVINAEGTHPYYCIPHGGPGGIGMAGIINATAQCDSNGMVNTSIQFNVTNGTTQGYNIFVDGIVLGGSPFTYDDTLGMNEQVIQIVGDGATHFITVQDLETSFCAATTSIEVIDCNADCVISNPTILFPKPTLHQVQVADFEFIPSVVNVLLGDTVEFIWTGVIPHTATSDATFGNTVFDSGLFGQGTIFQVVMTEEGSHPYYCIPHGAPGGIGMAGLIKVVSGCNNGIVAAALDFESVGTSMGYNIYVDGVLEGNSPHAYAPSGNNSLEIMLNGDGNTHTILIEDVDDNTCNNTITFDAPLCPTVCILELEASAPSACSNNNEVTYDLTIFSQNINSSGFNVFVNNDLLLGSPFSYSANDTTQLTITLPGDAQDYNIAISDAENSGCSDVTILTTPLCQNFCLIDLSLEQLSSCDNFGNVLFQLSVHSGFVGQSGFDVFVDGNSELNNPFPYASNDTTLITILLAGDGLSHEIIVYDVDDPTCADTIFITTDDCTLGCAMELTDVKIEVPQVHEVEVLDFEFFPKDITVDVGDTVRFMWIDVVSHTVTSDDQIMPEAFNSPLLGQGAVYDVVINDPMFVSYYCIPHGAPGGVGMAGTIEVLDPIADGLLEMTFSFQGNNLGVQGYDVFIDATPSSNNTFTYDLLGDNSFAEMLVADGLPHVLKVQDVEFPDCFFESTFMMPAQDGCFGYEADFVYGINQQTFEVNFIDTTSGDPDQWLWTFGDGNSSTVQNPNYIYQQEGDYEVCLIATNNTIMCADTICQILSIGEYTCESNFIFENDGLTVLFTDVSQTSEPITNWVYDFGNGLQSTGQQNPIFTFDTLGVYTVCLTIEADTCLAETCMVVDLSDVCLTFVPEYIYNFSNNVTGIQFTDLTGGNPSNWLWGFGDGNTSNEQNPYHVYDSSGTYNICLLVQDTLNNCNASFCESVTILPTATHDISIINQNLIIFPNPSQQSNYIWTVKGILEKNYYQDLKLKIYDVHGRTLKEEIINGQPQLQVDVPIGLAQGIYMLEIWSEGAVYRGKVVVQ